LKADCLNFQVIINPSGTVFVHFKFIGKRLLLRVGAAKIWRIEILECEFSEDYFRLNWGIDKSGSGLFIPRVQLILVLIFR